MNVEDGDLMGPWALTQSHRETPGLTVLMKRFNPSLERGSLILGRTLTCNLHSFTGLTLVPVHEASSPYMEMAKLETVLTERQGVCPQPESSPLGRPPVPLSQARAK